MRNETPAVRRTLEGRWVERGVLREEKRNGGIHKNSAMMVEHWQTRTKYLSRLETTPTNGKRGFPHSLEECKVHFS